MKTPHWKTRERIMETTLKLIAEHLRFGKSANVTAKDALLQAAGYETCTVHHMYNDPPGVSPITINGDVIESLEHERGRIYVAQASGKILTLDAENVIYYEPFENSGTDTSAKDDSAKAES